MWLGTTLTEFSKGGDRERIEWNLIGLSRYAFEPILTPSIRDRPRRERGLR